VKEQGFHKVPERVDMHHYDLGIFEPSGQPFHFVDLRDENILRVKLLQNGKGTNLVNPPPTPNARLGKLADLRV
jgi:hypothetical protein